MHKDTKDAALGLYDKYKMIVRNDGQSAIGGRHFGCQYYVLDITHDPFAAPALRAYADACEAEYPALARDLRALARGAA
jgi:hypothetical protein